MNDGAMLFLYAVGLFFAVLPFVLLARISHWSHATQQKLDKLDETNRLLALLVAARSTPPAPLHAKTPRNDEESALARLPRL